MFGIQLRDPHVAEIAHHIRQQITAGVANFIQQLLGHRCPQYLATRARRLVHHKAAVRLAIDDRVADVVPIGNVLPIGVQPAGGLATALDDVTGQTAARQLMKVVLLPAKRVDERPQGGGAVHAAAGDDDVGPRVQSLGDRPSAQVGIRAQHFLGQGFAAEHVGAALFAQPGQQRRDVVAFDHRDARLQT